MYLCNFPMHRAQDQKKSRACTISGLQRHSRPQASPSHSSIKSAAVMRPMKQ